MKLRQEEVIGRVRRALALEPTLAAPRIMITMLDASTVALAGVLDDPGQVHRAEQVARQAAHGLNVDNGLTVSSTRQAVVDDTHIGRLAAEALAAAIDTILARPVRASVEVINGLAHLRGACSTAKDRRVLIDSVARVPGLQAVIADGLEVAPFGSADDIQLGNLAEERLRREAPDLAGPVRVRVHERSAHLSGRVRNPREASRAVDVVMRQPGIKHVHSELECYQSGPIADADARLSEAVIHALGVAGLPMPNLHVFVHGGIATIDGHVETIDQKRKVSSVAREVRGVTRVDNLLEVGGEPPLPESEAPRA